MKSINDLVAIKPIAFNHERPDNPVKRYDVTDKLANQLVSTVVVFDSETFKAGDTVFLRANISNDAEYAKQFNLDGQVFSLVHKTKILMVKNK